MGKPIWVKCTSCGGKGEFYGTYSRRIGTYESVTETNKWPTQCGDCLGAGGMYALPESRRARKSDQD